ncbi:cytochrome oxidase subunit III [Bradymonadaceae bacterium TMQ3]|uniref:Cytochrome oxidase subunit III n=1 Tax=Lujinxingia sediminis TaxID=2480984 RepID=A0ABY0CTB8_9DELT|nr:cytochrome c oxidase subunit 3 [Lujinxingia sediminis]RDV38832.1 cytochrome oxidase subunit III [Bradymonadaceae bacterium TMQ3]RVU44066.1 cytochrome oxidase subunit III [Lujinxingia sediminis]TXC76396.1 cytochrome oxidase subunit III [Bradymonadales bacterium TMQ1]
MASQNASLAADSMVGEESLGVTNGKLGMWAFLVMDAMTFAGLLAGYARLRWTPGSDWPLPIEAFGFTGIQLTALNTFILICSSVSMVHVLAEQMRGNMERARKWMLFTIVGGLIFLGIQGFEWTHLIMDMWPYLFDEGYEAAYSVNFAATFFILTGFHGLHVSVGVIYNVIIYLGLRSGKITKDDTSVVEIAGLYWHFVDLVWILVFTFVYLI